MGNSPFPTAPAEFSKLKGETMTNECAIADDALLLSGADVCRRLGIGLSHFHNLRRSDKFPLTTIRLGASVRWREDELRQWIECGCPANADRWKMMAQATGSRRGMQDANRP
jgi:predicted DNA-binding transcriptional regulator AlpA